MKSKVGVMLILMLVLFCADMALAADPNIATKLWRDDFIVADFNYPEVLDSRWTKDIDPATGDPCDIYTSGDASGILFFNNGLTRDLQGGNLREYAHIETPIDMDIVTNVVGSSYCYAEAYEHSVGIYVYWDQDNWIGLHIDPYQATGSRIRCRGRAQGEEIFVQEGDTSWNKWYTLEMVFTDSQIKFYIEEVSTYPYTVEHASNALTSFTMARPSTFTGAATLIYGKCLGNAGPGGAAATNPDLDNSLTSSASYTANKYIKGRHVIVYGVEEASGCPSVIMPMDFNEDCYVDIADFAEFAAEWMTCNNPNDGDCAAF